ncbi:hypothetical protein [Streptomyces sp. NPDC048410]|uniref:hypothetical protein n=1 Tax=Streptomyces sp. NPDC048410 TaxID=3365545 RepID=UPI003710609E
MRYLFAAAGVGAALLLAGCSSIPSSTDTAYAHALSTRDPDDFGGINEEKLAQTLGMEGPDLCKQLKASYDDAVAYAREGFSQRGAEALVVEAADVYCPDRKAALPAG